MQLILKYFPNLPEIQKEQFTQLEDIYKDWNQKINLISRKDFEHFYERHVLHSLSIAKLIQFEAKTSIIDVGTGGGFPGIPLAIMFPEAEFLMVDSIAKKIMVVKDVIAQLNLKNAQAKATRIEQLKYKADFITARAVTQLPDFINVVKNNIDNKGFNKLKNGIIYLKGGDFAEELKSVSWKYKQFNIVDYFTEEYFETKKVVHLMFPY